MYVMHYNVVRFNNSPIKIRVYYIIYVVKMYIKESDFSTKF